MKRDTVVTDRFSMDYAVIGSGARPLVMLPGVSLHAVTPAAEAVADAYREFEHTHTIYLFDRKRELRAGETVASMAEDTAAAMRALGLSEADVFGASQGGMIALSLALRHPDLVRKIAVASAAARILPAAARVFAEWLALAETGDVGAVAHALNEAIYSAETKKRFAAALAVGENGTAEELARLVIMLRACLSFDCLAELGNVRCPALVLGAEEDGVLTAEASREMAAALCCECVLYRGYGHAVYDEAPDFKSRLHAFFSE